jgi:hypothetical protein
MAAGASAGRQELVADAPEAVTILNAQGALDLSQFLKIPGVAALISYVQAVWNNSPPVIANAQVQ